MAYTFEGILFSVMEDTLEVVGTDGKRIAIASSSFTGKGKEKIDEKKFLVPIPTLRTLVNILAISEDEEMNIAFSDNCIIFKDSSTELRSQLIEGRFPEYKKYSVAQYLHIYLWLMALVSYAFHP